MTVVKVVEDIDAPADKVWAAISDFGNIKVGGPVTSVDIEGNGVGMVRTIGMGGGRIIERLDRHDSSGRVFSYSIVNDDCPLPVSAYSSTAMVTDNGDGTSTVDWTGTFEPKGGEAEASAIVEGIYRGMIAGARKAVGG